MNLMVIVIDSLRQDHVGCYAGEQAKARTPAIDKLASQSALLTRCWSESLPTIPARRAMHTLRRTFPFDERQRPKGIYNRHRGWLPLPEEPVTVAEHLEPLGYVTALVADTYHIFKPAMNFHRYFSAFEWIRGQEFDRWKTAPLEHVDPRDVIPAGREPNQVIVQYLQNQVDRKTEEDYQAPRVFGKAIDWLSSNAAHEKFVLWVESFDPHEPWEAPQEYIDLYDPGYTGRDIIYTAGARPSDLSDAEVRHVKARYAAEVSMVDHWVGRLLDTLEETGRATDTVVLLISDHGKIVGDFNAFGMSPKNTSRSLYAVPTMIRHPGGEAAGTVHDCWGYNIDAMATVLGLMGVPPLPGAEGLDLWPVVTGQAAPPRDHLVCGYNMVHCVWQDEWLYIRDIEDETEVLYDLAADPEQEHNVAGDNADVRRDLAAKLDAVVQG